MVERHFNRLPYKCDKPFCAIFYRPLFLFCIHLLLREVFIAAKVGKNIEYHTIKGRKNDYTRVICKRFLAHCLVNPRCDAFLNRLSTAC